MFLNRVEVRHFRNLASVSISPVAGLNILEGKNASGKTSFLEALYMLGLARSFRTTKTNQLIQHDHDDLLLFAELSDTANYRIGIQRFSDNRLVIRLNGETLHRRAQLVQLLPIQIITPDSLSLLTGSPSERRQYLDWMMFHVEPNFHNTWSDYQRSIRQRNVLLRESRAAEIPFWSRGLAEQGARIDELRVQTVKQILPHIHYFVDLLLPGLMVAVNYRQGWKAGKDLEEALSDCIDTDLKLKYTTVGPHRAELLFSIGNERVVDLLSRGQLKLLLCALKLAQLAYIKDVTNKSSVVLVDDLPAELDIDHRRQLLSLLHDLQNQVFVTTTDRTHLDYSSWSDVKVFHVEHGKIKEVV